MQGSEMLVDLDKRTKLISSYIVEMSDCGNAGGIRFRFEAYPISQSLELLGAMEYIRLRVEVVITTVACSSR